MSRALRVRINFFGRSVNESLSVDWIGGLSVPRAVFLAGFFFLRSLPSSRIHSTTPVDICQLFQIDTPESFSDPFNEMVDFIQTRVK